MPPKKEKKEQFKGDEATEMILEYLTQQNRPYSATDVSSNLHNAVTKVTATKLLKEMHDSGQIEGRVSGKQAVYHAIQDPKESVSEEDLKAIDEEIEAVKEETTALKARMKELQASLSSLRATPSVPSLKTSIALLEPEIQELKDTLATLQAGAMKPVDPIEKAAAEADYKRIEKAFLKRRKQFKEFWTILCDSTESNPGELWETLGLEGEP